MSPSFTLQFLNWITKCFELFVNDTVWPNPNPISSNILGHTTIIVSDQVPYPITGLLEHSANLDNTEHHYLELHYGWCYDVFQYLFGKLNTFLVRCYLVKPHMVSKLLCFSSTRQDLPLIFGLLGFYNWTCFDFNISISVLELCLISI